MRIRNDDTPAGERRGRDGAKGQALVELAFVVPIAVLLLVAAAQFGLIFERQIGIENAARDAARRAAAIPTNDSNVAANVDTATTGAMAILKTLLMNAQGYDPAQATRSICYSTSADVSGTCGTCPAPPALGTDPSGSAQVQVTVTVRYKHPLFLPLISAMIDPIDGVTDNALAVSWASTFKVQNGSTDTLSANVCRTNSG